VHGWSSSRCFAAVHPILAACTTACTTTSARGLLQHCNGFSDCMLGHHGKRNLPRRRSWHKCHCCLPAVISVGALTWITCVLQALQG
jgi:DUF1680 family protein